MRVVLFSLLEYLSSGVVFVFGTALYIHGYENPVDRSAANIMYLSMSIWLFAIGVLTAAGWDGMTRPDHYSFRDWFFQELVIHGDWYIAVSLFLVTLALRAKPDLPLEFIRFVLGNMAALWILGVAVLAHKVSGSSVAPIFTLVPDRLEKLSRSTKR